MSLSMTFEHAGALATPVVYTVEASRTRWTSVRPPILCEKARVAQLAAKNHIIVCQPDSNRSRGGKGEEGDFFFGRKI